MAAALCTSLVAGAQPGARPQVDFVYFGSPDCPYCRSWEAHDLRTLEKSSSFRHIRFTQITKAVGAPIPSALSFPQEIRNLREPIAAKLEGAGSPMFAILTDGMVVEAWRGSKKYSPDQIIKIIRQQQTQTLVRTASKSAAKP